MAVRYRAHPLDGPTMLDTEEAAHYLQLPAATLIAWRSRKTGPIFTRLGRHVRYRLEDLNAFIEAGVQTGGDDER